MPRSRLALVVLLSGCAGQPVDTLTVSASDTTQFTATLQTSSGPGLAVTVLFTDVRSLVTITTDGGETLALADTAAHAPPAMPHPRLGSGEAVELAPADAEYPSARALLDTLVARGAKERPTPAESATPLYGAAYFAAYLAGKVPDPYTPDWENGAHWPYPRRDAWMRATADQVPQVLLLPGAPCCGGSFPIPGDDCRDCVPKNPKSDDDWWCAAGDHCNDVGSWNSYPGGDCGDPITSDGTHFHMNSTIINFFGGPKAYCAAVDSQGEKDAWAALGRYCSCPGGTGDFCPADAKAPHDKYGCDLPPGLAIGAQTVVHCEPDTSYKKSPPGKWSAVTQCTNGTCRKVNSHGATCDVPEPPAPDPCKNTSSGGLFCGQSTQFGFGPGLDDWLYDCENHVTKSKSFCSYGCYVAQPGTNDRCQNADPCSGTTSGGLFCGQSRQGGFSGGQTDWLYDCENHATKIKSYCPTSCVVEQYGTQDHCEQTCTSCPTSSHCDGGSCACDGDVCGSRCCPAGDFCGSNGRCCDGITCMPGCPC